MTRIRFLFVLFSFIVLAAPVGAQDREHGRGRQGSGVLTRRSNDDEREARRVHDDDGEDDGDRGDRVERRGDRRDDDEDNDRDDDGDDDDDRGVSRSSNCTDRNGNNVCDVVGRGATLPEMVNAILVSRGQLTRSGQYWLGNGALAPRYTTSANRVPSRVTWLDRTGRVAQVWLDSNRDGRADVVRMYRGGRLVRTVKRR